MPFADLLAPDRWPAFVLVTARLSGLMISAPLWSMTAVPRRTRAAVTVVLTALLLPAVPPGTLPESPLALPVPIALELVLGVTIGLTASVLVQGATLAGEVVALQMGLSIGPALSPSPDVQVSGVGQLKGVFALLIYAGLGGHLMLLRGLADSLRALPPGAPMDVQQGGTGVVLALSGLFSTAVQTAAPVMVTLLLVNVALAILSRAVPQLNAMMVAFPVTIGVGLLMLGAALPLLGAALGSGVSDLPAEVGRVVNAFSPVPVP